MLFDMKKSECLVTVIIPAYNHEKYIIECLESIHQQTYRDFQWIVVDDCSKDRTPIILKENQSKYGYQLILHKKNLGISATLTEALKNYVKGKYVTICASDDVFMPNKVEKQLNYMEEHPQYGMCYSRSIMMNEQSECLLYKDNCKYKSGYIFKEVLCRDFFMGICTMFRTDVLREVGYFKEGVIAEDYYIYALIAQKYEIGFLDMYLNKYRVAEMSSKRDPWILVQSHRQTVELFKDTEIYLEAIREWEVRSSIILARYRKYKKKAVIYCLKNLNRYIINPIDGLRMIRLLLFMWK